MPPTHWDPEWIEFAKTLGALPAYPKLGEELRAMFNGLMIAAAQQSPPLPDNVIARDFSIPSGPNVRVYKPKPSNPDAPTPSLPMVLFIHGGGWFAGHLETEDRSARIFCHLAQAWVVSVDYTCNLAVTLHQEIDDCHAAFNWAQSRATDHGCDPDKIVLWGGSAGAALAAALAYRLIQEGRGGQIGGLISMNGLHLHPDATPEKYKSLMTSYSDNDGPLPLVSGKNTLDLYDHWKIGPPETDISLFPAAGGPEAVKGFPPTFIITSDNDASRDDGTVLEAVLQEARVRVKRENVKGFAHYFWTFHLPKANERFWNSLAGGLKWVLNEE